MKRILPFLGVMIMGIMVWSCDSEGRLAKDLTGTWAGTPENFTDHSAITASVIDTYEFMPDTCPSGPTHAGPLTIAGMISTSTQVVGDGAEPIELSAAARSIISGSWTVVDDDEILLRLDPATLDIMVDPEDVAVSTNPLSPSGISVDSLRTAMSATIRAGLYQALLTRYASMMHLDDIEIKGQLMKFEINDIDYTLTRQE